MRSVFLPAAAARPTARLTRSQGVAWAGVLGAWCMGCACGGALAQTGGRSLTLVPTFDTSLTYTEVKNSAAGASSDVTDSILQVRPGVRLSGRSARVTGSLSYGADYVQHSLKSADSGLQNSLYANLNADVIENWMSVDAAATVAQRALSASGQQTVAGSVQENSNRVEVGTVSVTPRVHGSLAGLARYDVSLTAAATNTRKSISGDSSNTGGSVNLNSASDAAVFSWGLQATHQRSEFRAGRATSNDRVSLSLFARPDPEVQLSVRGGQESTDVIGIERVKYSNWGAGAKWTPNERTVVSADTDERYFGRSHRIVVEHRLPLSSFRFSSTNDASTSSNPNGVGTPVTLYQLYDALYLSRYPDPFERDNAVRDLLRSLGQDGNTIVSGGFVSNAVTLQRREDLAWTYSGRRATFSVQAFRSQTTTLDSTAQQAGNPAVRQQGYTGSVSYRLTPTSSTSLSGSRLMTPATANSTNTDLKSLSLGWTDQLSRFISTSLSARYSVFNSLTSPYRETALTATLALRF